MLVNNQHKFYANFFRWLNWLCLLLLWLFVFSLFCHNLVSFSQDLGRHLKAGEVIVQQQKVFKNNLFSFSYPQFPFINHHWLAEVIFFLFTQYFGLKSLIALSVIIFSLLFFSLLWFSVKKSGWLISFGWGFLLLFLLSQRSDIRPEIFSYLFLSFYLIILNKASIFKKYWFILPLMQLFWVNIHIYFFLGPTLLFLYLINNLIYKLKIKNHKQLFLVCLTFSLSVLACLLNPNFINGALYPLLVFKNYGYRIVENQSIFFMTHYYGRLYNPYFLLIFFASLITFFITLNNQSFYTISSFLFFSFLGFQAIRNIPLFALVAFVSVNQNLLLIKEKIKQKFKPELFLNFKLLFYFIFVPLILFLTYQNMINQTYQKRLSDKRFGFADFKGVKEGAEFILDNKIAGPMFNNFDIGSALIYYLYPQYQVFVDGRPEAYPASFFNETYIPMQESEKEWQKIVEEYNFNFIFFSHTDITPWAINFLTRIGKDKDWQLVFLDDYAVVFLKQNKVNQVLINKYALNENSFTYSCHKQIDCYARILNILNILNWSKTGLQL